MLTLLGSLLGFITSALPQRLAGIAIKLKLFGPSP